MCAFVLWGGKLAKAKSLFHSISLSNLIAKYQDIGFDWQIRKGSMEQRYSKVKGKYEEFFVSQFKDIERIKNHDLIGFLDSLSLMKILHDQLTDLKNIDVSMEFLIPYANDKRIDYVLSFKNTIILLEFSYFDSQKSEKQYMEKYHLKLVQVMQYEKLLQNLISSRIKTIPYVVLYSPEVDDNKESIKNSNKNKMIELAEFVRTLYYKDLSATEELSNLFT